MKVLRPRWIRRSLTTAVLSSLLLFTFSCSRSRTFPTEKRDVFFIDLQAGVTLAGTLTMPRGPGPFPAVLLVGGSGPEARGPYRLLIAEALAQKGIAALCYDKRGCGNSTGDFRSATLKDFKEDALAGVDFLRQYPVIVPQKVGVIGHSEGGTVSTLMAAESKDVAFIVMMAAPGFSGEEFAVMNLCRRATIEGADEKTLAVIKETVESFLDAERKQKNDALLLKDLQRIGNLELSKLNGGERNELTDVLGDMNSFEKAIFTPHHRYFMTLDLQAILRKIHCPVLAVNGEKDAEIDGSVNLQKIGEMLKEGGNPDYTLKAFPGLNHGFQHCATGSPREKIPYQPTIAPEAMRFIVDWVQKRVE